MKTLFILIPLLTAGVASASDDRVDVVIPDVTVVDFETVDVSATLQRPAMTPFFERQDAQFVSFITLRAHFSPEMSHSLSAL